MYKKSRFLFEANYLDNKIYYNCITDEVLVVNNADKELLDNILNDSKNYLNHYPTLIDGFVNKRFLVETMVDEYEELILRNRLSIFSNKNYMLTIIPTLNCNLSCWYCTAKDEKPHKINDKVQLNIKKHISHLLNNNHVTGIHLDWFGGEPLLHFYDVIYPISQYTKEACLLNHQYSNHVTTNAVLIDEEMCSKFNEIGLRSFQISIDGNEKKHNKVKNVNGVGTFSKVLENINSVLEKVNNSRLTLRINYDNKTLDGVIEIFEKIDSKNRHRVVVDLQRVWQTKSQSISNEKLIEIIDFSNQLGYDTRYALFDRKEYHTCYSDRFYHSVINHDGNIYKCTAAGYEKENIIGHLLDNGQIHYNSLYKLFNKATFENDLCKSCRFLGLCYGPCSDKIKRISRNQTSFANCCSKNFFEIGLEQYLVLLAKKRNLIN